VGNLVEAWHVGVRRADCLRALDDPSAAAVAADAQSLRARLLEVRGERDPVAVPAP
jgi:hypothetical protein